MATQPGWKKNISNERQLIFVRMIFFAESRFNRLKKTEYDYQIKESGRELLDEKKIQALCRDLLEEIYRTFLDMGENDV